ncbi:RNA recognition motif domain-containing protein [Methylomonas rivi]|uniref:RNA-binding protein n=1 Tax=Methylomonas rivi TaxID=2952226 RepID=A0ABT1U5X1_9GAMM|nr:RNA-binding protein [Methylomonas sp. WSC-6]MCQ8128898.1 RNA-binding protein [Methylomonas sp. WSC-6]
MLTLVVRGIPPTATESGLHDLFAEYGKVFGMKVNQDFFTGQLRGFATVDMEGHEARAAISAINGRDFLGKTIYVEVDKGVKGGRGRRR